MATLGQTITTTPTTLSSVTSGVSYSLQPPAGSILLFHVGTSTPTVGTSPRAEIHGPESLVVRAETGESIYVWRTQAGSFVVAYDEAA